MLAFTNAETIVIVVAAFFIVLALLAAARGIIRRDPSPYRRFRVGVFVERDHAAERPDDNDIGP